MNVIVLMTNDQDQLINSFVCHIRYNDKSVKMSKNMFEMISSSDES